jgi:hypothetical protein
MTRTIHCTLLSIAALILGACASAPTHYYTLVAPDYARDVAPAVPFLIEVSPVGIPSQVDVPQLVVRQGDGRIAVLDSERWAAPLNDELRAALSADLVRTLGTQDVGGLARPPGKQVLRVRVEVRRFESVPAQYALIDANWNLEFADKSTDARLFCHSHLRESIGSDYVSVVRGHQQAIAALAAQIAGAARLWVSSRNEACPA